MESIERYLFELTFEDGTVKVLKCEKVGSEWRFDDFTITEPYTDIVVDELKNENEHLESITVYKVECKYYWGE